MSSIQKLAKGYRAQVYVRGIRDSASFRTKREAEAWAANRTVELSAEAKKPVAERHTLKELLELYRGNVSPTKRGARWESLRIDAILDRKMLPIDSPLSDISDDDLRLYRDERKKVVQAGTILREFSLLSAVFEYARVELKWITENPCADVKKPSSPAHRDRLIALWEVRRMLKSLGHRPGKGVRSVAQAIAGAFIVALSTGMRAGELCKLRWDQVHDGYCVLPVTKTVPRNVPLSNRAQRRIERMRGWDDELVFAVSPQTMDAMFRKHRDRAGLSGFTFHDSRHCAATKIARTIDVLSLCKMFGWSNPKRAMIYYNPTATDIADMINEAPARGQSRRLAPARNR